MSTSPTQDLVPAFIIYLNGWPGVGKLTGAREFQSLIKGSQILHNHELIDPVEKHYPRSSPKYASERAAYRRTRLSEVAEQPRVVFIFTDAQTEYNACVDDYVRLARAPYNRRFYSIVLDCELGENVRRLESDERRTHSNGKLTDAEVLRDYRATMEIFRFVNNDELVLDVSKMSAEVAAAKIADFVKLREQHSASTISSFPRELQDKRIVQHGPATGHPSDSSLTQPESRTAN